MVIAVREGIVQLGSLNKVLLLLLPINLSNFLRILIINSCVVQIAEDLNLVMSIQRKFSCLQSVPGVFAIQRPYLPIQYPYILKPNIQMMESTETAVSAYNMSQVSGVKRLIDETSNYASMKSIDMGWNSPHPQNGTGWPPLWSPPPPLPLLPKLPSVVPSHNSIINLHDNRINSSGLRVKVEECGFHITDDGDQKVSFNANMELQDGVAAGSGLKSK